MVDVVMESGAATDRDRVQSYVVFRLGGEGYALEVMRVQEVLDMQSLTEVPGGPKFAAGRDQPPGARGSGLRSATSFRFDEGRSFGAGRPAS